MIALLAMHAAGEGATGADIAAKVGDITDPNGTPVSADAAGFAQAKAVLDGGGTVSYQGATGNVQFDANGDVSAPAVTWVFSEDGISEQKYISLTEVNDFMASLN
jgi:branched-chain amino acid transport system substrate-binding protein